MNDYLQITIVNRNMQFLNNAKSMTSLKPELVNGAVTITHGITTTTKRVKSVCKLTPSISSHHVATTQI